MRLSLALLLATFAVLPATVAFADDKPAVDLVGAIVIGAADGATWSFGGQITAVLKETAPGMFEGPAATGGQLVQFSVAEKSKCVFDLVFTIDKQVQGGLELDANKMKTVTFTDAKPAATWTDYTVTIDGAKGVVQNLAPDGSLSEMGNSSPLSTSLAQADLEADVAALQAICPAAG